MPLNNMARSDSRIPPTDSYLPKRLPKPIRQLFFRLAIYFSGWPRSGEIFRMAK